jgi:ribosome-binding protein aMBF1 (putative translation factor)
MRYAQMFPNYDFDIQTFSAIFKHHLRRRGLSLEEYSTLTGEKIEYIKALATGETYPNTLIFKEMGLILNGELSGKLRNIEDDKDTEAKTTDSNNIRPTT